MTKISVFFLKNEMRSHSPFSDLKEQQQTSHANKRKLIVFEWFARNEFCEYESIIYLRNWYGCWIIIIFK